MVNILKTGDIKVLEQYAGPDCYARVTASRHLCCRTENAGCLLAFHFYDVAGGAQKEDKVCLYCDEHNVVFVCGNKKCLHMAEQVGEQNSSYRWLLEFFMAMTGDDIYALEKLEDKITRVEDGFLSKEKRDDDSLQKIITIRRSLLKMKRYYEQLSLVTSDLAEDEAGIIPEELKKRFVLVDRRVDHLLGSVLHLRDAITQVREAYQAEIDIAQNQTMKVLTVVSAIFLPLTLIVGWFGMNLQMPEYGWQFGYPYVIILCVIVCASCLALLKFKRWY